MQNSNLLFTSKTRQGQFWNKNFQRLTDVLQDLNHIEGVQLVKVGKLLKRDTVRIYKICKHYLFYCDGNKVKAFVNLKNVYFQSQKNNDQTMITLIHDNLQQTLYGPLSNFKSFIQEMEAKCILLDFPQRYKILKQIGVGSTCQVFLGQCLKDNQEYAIKTINKDSNKKNQESKIRALMEEISIMRTLCHPNILQLHHVFETESNIYRINKFQDQIHLILSLFQGKELLEKIPNFNFNQKKTLSYSLIEAMAYIHGQGIMHRDLKPQNIIYKSQDPDDTQFVIGDFGFATRIKQIDHVLYRCGTPGYVAPEILDYRENQDMYNQKCDVFSLGVIIYQMYQFFFKFFPKYRFYGFHPFKSRTKEETIKLNVSANLNFEERWNIPSSLINLLQFMLQKNPKSRCSMQSAMEHQFFKEDHNFDDSQIRLTDSVDLSKNDDYSKYFQDQKGANKQSFYLYLFTIELNEYLKGRLSVCSTDQKQISQKQESQGMQSIKNIDNTLKDIQFSEQHQIPKQFIASPMLQKYFK